MFSHLPHIHTGALAASSYPVWLLLKEWSIADVHAVCGVEELEENPSF